MFPEIQIIFYSGTDHPETLKQIIKFRPEGYVDKNMPLAMHELVKVVVNCLANIKHNMEFVVKAKEFLKS
jgi:DNA-binding NarL/FixJ family response regulator